MGYTVDEAAELARVLVGDTVAEMEDGAERAKEAGKNTGKSHADGINSTKGDNKKSAQDIADLVDDRFSLGKDTSNKHGKDKGEAHNKGIGSTKGANIRTTQDIVKDLLGEMGKGDGDAQSSGKNKGTAHSKGVSSTRSSNLTASNLLRNTVTSTLGRTTDGGGGSRAGTMFASGIRGRAGSASSAGSSVARSGERGLRSVRTSGAGSNFVAGFRSSISSGRGSVWNTAWSLGQSALSALRSSIRTASPSKETAITGNWFTQGFQIGIEEEEKKAINQAVQLARNTHGAMNSEIDKLSQRFRAANYVLAANKDVLKIEHEINNSKLENKITSLENTIKQLTDTLITLTKQQHQQVQAVAEREIILQMDNKKVGKGVAKTVTKQQSNHTDLTLRRLGYR